MLPALKKGLQIPELFSARHRVLTIGELADRLEVSTSAIYRTVVTLTEMNYLKKTDRNAYELGPMVLSRGFCYLASRDILNTAAAHLDELRDETSASCHPAIREGIAAINVSVPDFIVETSDVREHLTGCLIRAARTISTDMGWP